MSNPILISKLKVSYAKTAVIENLDVAFEESKINGLVGMNGAGKTTLLRAIFGMKDYQSGEVIWRGDSLKPNQIAYLETENYFYPKMKGKEYLELFKLKNPAYNPEKWNALFELPLNRLVDDYSTGMKKKLALLGVLALDRDIIMLDEPFNGVDLESNEKIKLVIERLRNQGKTIIITSHIIDTLLSLADNISILNKGKIELTAQRSEFSEVKDYLSNSISNSASNAIAQVFGSA